MEYSVWRPSEESQHIEKTQRNNTNRNTKKSVSNHEQMPTTIPSGTTYSQEGFTNKFNKRNVLNNKLNERYLTGQISRNPFMNNNDYIEDIKTQDAFLVPRNSNYETPPFEENQSNTMKNPYE